MRKELIKNTISYLKGYLDETTKEYNIVFDSKTKIEEKGYGYIISHDNSPIYSVAEILINNGYTTFLKAPMTHNEYCALIINKPLAFFKKNIKKTVYENFADVKMKCNNLLDADSYCLLMRYLYKIKSNLEFIDSRNESFSKNKKYNVSKTNYVEKLINEPINQFCNLINAYIAQYGKVIKTLEEIIELLEKINELNLDSNHDQFVSYCNEFFEKLSNLPFENKELSTLKINLKEVIKGFAKQEETKDSQNDITPKSIKLGKKTDRMKRYAENKKREELKSLKGNLTSDSKLWVDILLEQLQNIDEADFINNPYEYIPMEEEQLDLILDVVGMELSSDDTKNEIVKTLKEIKRVN